MIIAFYPGGGGNRYYYYYTNGQKNFELHTAYDRFLTDQPAVYRYLDDQTIGLPDKDLILTHCVNVPLLQRHFPNQKEIIVIVADPIKCLKREWVLAAQHREQGFDDPVEHARSIIGFHNGYYNQYPLDTTGASNIINIESDQTDFAQLMRNEINSIESQSFDQAFEQSTRWLPQELHEQSGDKIVDGFKSKFLSDAEIMQQRLDKISPSLCLAKWKQVSLHLTTGMNNSCYHPPLHVIPIEEIQRKPSALHNTEYKKTQRKLMLEGTRPAECSYCWAMEDNGKLSDRHYRSGEPWAEKDFGKIVSSEWNDDFDPSYVEVNFNSVCNLRCSYCSPQFSSSWMDEAQRDGAYPTSTPHNDPAYFTGNRRPIPNREHNPYVEAFWEWWPELYPQLEHFRMTGGEPLLDKNTYRVFDYVLLHDNPKLHLNVTSNFSVDEKSWQRYLGYVKMLCNDEDPHVEHFMQYVSLDAMFERAEYIRNGLDFNLLWDRVNQFLTEIPGRSSITFIITMNNLSVSKFEQLMTAILGLRQIYSNHYQRVWFDTPVLRTPSWQSMQLLPESYADHLEEVWVYMLKNAETESTRYKGFKDYEIARLDRDIAWMRDGAKLDEVYVQRNKADFYRFFAEHDRRRGTDFLATFPEMRSWWEQCRYYANNS